MKHRKSKSFEKQLDAILAAMGRSFRGIRLHCTECGEIAFAASPAIAETFGWSNLRHVKGPNYHGLCVECRGKEQPQNS